MYTGLLLIARDIRLQLRAHTVAASIPFLPGLEYSQLGRTAKDQQMAV